MKDISLQTNTYPCTHKVHLVTNLGLFGKSDLIEIELTQLGQLEIELFQLDPLTNIPFDISHSIRKSKLVIP